ncbi:hypothetical protein, partial [Francisella tularensis]|uniref:hypothetical protein n=1 Tax=Francisella tularensis TaxID=263 RepID=UPI001CC28418
DRLTIILICKAHIVILYISFNLALRAYSYLLFFDTSSIDTIDNIIFEIAKGVEVYNNINFILDKNS